MNTSTDNTKTKKPKGKEFELDEGKIIVGVGIAAFVGIMSGGSILMGLVLGFFLFCSGYFFIAGIKEDNPKLWNTMMNHRRFVDLAFTLFLTLFISTTAISTTAGIFGGIIFSCINARYHKPVEGVEAYSFKELVELTRKKYRELKETIQDSFNQQEFAH